MLELFNELPVAQKILALLLLAIAAHVLTRAVSRYSVRLNERHLSEGKYSKLRTIVSLLTSVFIFTIYFLVVGLILSEFGVSLKAYLASASIIGLAVGFGSQNLVQDVITGLTVVFTDLFDVGDMVEIGGQTGIVKRVGIRFTLLQNHMGAEVFIPNRALTKIINYPHGFVRCLVDVSVPYSCKDLQSIANTIETMTSAVEEQFPAIFQGSVEHEGWTETSIGNHYYRVKFRIWPGRGQPLESTFKNMLCQALTQQVPEFQDWMVAVNYQVDVTA
ncbi:MAG: mechanosensitive ion channel domain-containing protein [Pseudomonadota bacterium]